MSSPTAIAAPEVSPGQEELLRILASRTFSKSPRLCSMLEFIVRHSVEGRHAELTEQQIGIQVFGRAPGYNSSDDTIVRGTARHLRQRLDQYYASEGLHDPLRIDIPRGGYVANFASPPAVELLTPAVGCCCGAARAVVRPAVDRRGSASRARAGCPGWSPQWSLLSVALAWLGIAYRNQAKLAARDVPVLEGPQPLWQALFSADRKTLIVPGDASLDAFIAWEQRSVTLEQYATQIYHRQATVTQPPTHKDVPLSTRSATPMADLALVATLVACAGTHGPAARRAVP